MKNSTNFKIGEGMEMENTILNENCLDGLLKIKDGTVDLIVTDPPYSVGVSSNGSRSNFSDNNLIIPFFKELFCQLRRVLKEGGEFYMFTDWRTYPILYPLLEKNFSIRNCIVWDFERIKAGAFSDLDMSLSCIAQKAQLNQNFLEVNQMFGK